jgi:tetratricopeptide (TPR) repeat protein
MWLTIMLLVMFLLGLKAAIPSFKQAPRKKPGVESQRPSLEPRVSSVTDPNGHNASDIEGAINSGNWDWARAALQKWSYGMVGNQVSQAEKDRFKALMTRFAEKDPLYREVMGLLLPVIKQNEGILQSKIYGYAPRYDQETLRYVLYFADELGEITRLKKGNSYQLFGPVREIIIQPEEKIGQTGLTATMVINKNPIDERIAALHREATQHKESNWAAAIACLQDASDLMRRHNSHYVLDRWTRLPVFLQQAGRYEEAMQEFQRLLSEVKARVEKEAESVTLPSYRRKLEHQNFEHIYDKMRMVCKREKLPDKALEYQTLAEKHRMIVDELSALLEIERKAEYEAFLARREQLRLG